jgi:hypothetical protein
LKPSKTGSLNLFNSRAVHSSGAVSQRVDEILVMLAVFNTIKKAGYLVVAGCARVR